MSLDRWVFVVLLALAVVISIGIPFGDAVAAWWWRLRHPRGRAW